MATKQLLITAVESIGAAFKTGFRAVKKDLQVLIPDDPSSVEDVWEVVTGGGSSRGGATAVTSDAHLRASRLEMLERLEGRRSAPSMVGVGARLASAATKLPDGEWNLILVGGLVIVVVVGVGIFVLGDEWQDGIPALEAAGLAEAQMFFAPPPVAPAAGFHGDICWGRASFRAVLPATARPGLLTLLPYAAGAVPTAPRPPPAAAAPIHPILLWGRAGLTPAWARSPPRLVPRPPVLSLYPPWAIAPLGLRVLPPPGA